MNILIIDDEPSDLNLISLLLRRSNPSLVLTEATSCEDAKRLCAGQDLIIIDQKLVGTQGIECIRELRGEGFRGVIMMLTGSPDDQLEVEARSHGADAFLTKDKIFDKLVEAVDRAVERRRESLQVAQESAAKAQELDKLQDKLSSLKKDNPGDEQK